MSDSADPRPLPASTPDASPKRGLAPGLAGLSRAQAFFLLPLLFAAVLALLLRVPLSHFLRDPAAVVAFEPYVGALSTLGFGMWMMAAGACGITWIALRGRSGAGLFRDAALLTAVLGFDDVYQIHERILPWLGIRENIVMVGYGILLLLFIALHRGTLRRLPPQPRTFLLVALGWFALSVAIDVLVQPIAPADGWGNEARRIVEDSAKFLGIGNWLLFLATSARIALGERAPGSTEAHAEANPV